MTPCSAFKILLEHFGPQGWWPVTPLSGRTPVYRPRVYVPQSETERFEIALGAILTQNTSWKNVERALSALFAEGIRTPRGLLAVPPEKLRRLSRPSGYFVQKEKKLRIFARHLVREHPRGLGAWLGGKDLDLARRELLSLWGIGPETADSILLYAGGQPVCVVDAYTLRIGKRLGWYPEKTDYAAAQKCLRENLPAKAPIYNEFHALMVALGKNFCKKTPVCANCPMKRKCAGKKGEKIWN